MSDPTPEYVIIDPEPPEALRATLDQAMFEALALRQPRAIEALRHCLANGYTPELIGTLAKHQGADAVIIGLFYGAARYIVTQEAQHVDR
jgi:hypothetical protein